jgi:hypothetical protein
MKPLAIIAFVAISQIGFSQSAPEAQELIEWLPDQLNEFSIDGQPVGTASSYNGKAYRMALKRYRKDKSTLAITVFDYSNRPEAMDFSSSIQEKNNSIQKIERLEIQGHKSYTVLNRKDGSAQLYINVGDRYLVFLSSTKCDAESLPALAGLLPLTSL